MSTASKPMPFSFCAALASVYSPMRVRARAHRFARMLVTVLALGLCLPLAALAQVRLTGPVDEAPLSGRLGFLDDEAGQLTIADVIEAERTGRFRPLPGTLSRGYTSATSWLTFTVRNDSGHALEPWLRMAPQMLDVVDVYLQHEGSGDKAAHYTLYPQGDRTPAAQKPERLPIMAVPIPLDLGEMRRVFVRIQTTSSQLFDADLVSAQRYQYDAARKLMWISAYAALALGVALVTFMQALRLRDLTHGLYGMLPVGLCLNIFGTENVTALLLPTVAWRINDWVVGVSMFLAFGGLSLFAMRLFDTRRQHPIGHRYLQLIVVLGVLTTLASGTPWYGRFATPLLTLGLGYWAFLTWAGMQMVRSGDAVVGRLFVLAFTVPMLGAAVGLAHYLGWLPQSKFTQYIVPVTSLIHMLLMTLSLTERLRVAEAKTEVAVERAALERHHRRDQEKLLAMISHEIRTPAAVIDAAVQTLQVLDPDATPEREERYDRIRRSANRLSLLVEFANTRGDPGISKVSLQRGPVRPAVLTDEIISLLDAAQRSRFVITTADDLPVIEADARLLRLNWLNLIDNACNYSRLGTPIRIAIRRVRAERGDQVEWSIETDGPPISDALAARIFDRFERGREYGDKAGLGLGLYLARHVAVLHGGTLTLERDGTIARFVCRIPITTESMEPGA